MGSRLNLDSELVIGVDNVKEVAHASPTTQVRLDLMSSFAGDTTKPNTLSKVVLVDTGGSERDNATISTTDWSTTSITNGYRATCSKTINITANYSIAKVRLYGGTTLYFEYTLASAISVTSGSVVYVTIQIDATWNISHTSGGTLVSASVDVKFGQSVINRLCLGTEKGKKLNSLQLKYLNNLVATPVGSVSSDSTNIRITVSISFIPSEDVTIDEYDYMLEDLSTVVAYVKINSVTLGGGLTHTWTYTVNF
jgi:hypothetical protein